MRKMGILSPVALGVSSIFLASPLWAQQSAWNGGYPCGPHMMWWNGGWSGMILGPLLMIVVPVVLVAVVILVLPRFWPQSTGSSSAPPQAPLDILKGRFARGEIDREEYEERRRILSERDDAR